MFCPQLLSNNSWAVLRWKEQPETLYLGGARWPNSLPGSACVRVKVSSRRGGRRIGTGHSIGLAVLLNVTLPWSGLRTKGKRKYPNALPLGIDHTRQRGSKRRRDKARSRPCPARWTTGMELQLSADFSWRQRAARLSPLRSKSSWWVTETAFSSWSEALLWSLKWLPRAGS